MNGVDEPVRVERPQAGLCVLRLNRPGRLNAMDVPALQHFHRVLDEVLGDRSVRVIVLAAEGPGFCAGLDLKSVLDDDGSSRLDVGSGYELQLCFAGLIQRLRATDATVIAAVQGVAVGAGMALTLAADIRIASTQAAFHVGAVRIGITAGECGISYHLPRLIGASRAFELMLTGRPVSAGEALQIGLVADVVAPDDLHARVITCAQAVLANSPYATAHTKRLMWSNLDAGSLDAAIELENHTQVLGLMTQDFAEAAKAFVEKRKPVFTGR
ncbi:MULTISPECIES: enoyl-CoA hydratase/isomerase family protein [Hydrogenophaga]|uniref:Enoyl-CoA hydratase/isomerase n=1 Tax=Hydrogenophaga electricum TaxID=1230953 RepID=A0ABQ6C969_9BURK|nr:MULTISPECIES: enoyl-CoA hydratase-related protein [Hydrogenophaga]GLS14826.1 putative enoyl-CoA hydratase/isomerase [Hydrogenophaga electricum]